MGDGSGGLTGVAVMVITGGLVVMRVDGAGSDVGAMVTGGRVTAGVAGAVTPRSSSVHPAASTAAIQNHDKIKFPGSNHIINKIMQISLPISDRTSVLEQEKKKIYRSFS